MEWWVWKNEGMPLAPCTNGVLVEKGGCESVWGSTCWLTKSILWEELESTCSMYRKVSMNFWLTASSRCGMEEDGK